VMAAPATADRGSGARLRAGSARGMTCRPSRVDGLSERVGQRSSAPAAASGENEGSVRVATRSRVRICYDWKRRQDVTQCSAIGTLPRRAILATGVCEALETMYPSLAESGHPTVRGDDDC
jgi:hypothetical protein